MVDDCIFCDIVTGDLPSRIVYEDDQILAFLDVNPVSRGHTVVIPKTHHETLADMPSELNDSFGKIQARLVPIIERAVNADGTTVGVNNGKVAGQEVPHIHAHIIPRFDGDSGGALHSIMTPGPDLSDNELDEIAIRITDNNSPAE